MHTFTHALTLFYFLDLDNSEGAEDEDILDDSRLPTGKIGTKKMRKLQAKAEKKAMREVRTCVTTH